MKLRCSSVERDGNCPPLVEKKFANFFIRKLNNQRLKASNKLHILITFKFKKIQNVLKIKNKKKQPCIFFSFSYLKKKFSVHNTFRL